MNEAYKEIKASFRSRMNGVVAQSMRERGANYKIIWGIPLTDLQQMARQYTPDAALAQRLWEDDVRECKIMALQLMPHDALDEQAATQWVQQLQTQEMAELAAFLLFQHADGAAQWAYHWTQSTDNLIRLCGYHTLIRQLRHRAIIAGTQEFVSDALAFLADEQLQTLQTQTQEILLHPDRHPIFLLKAANQLLQISQS